MLRSALLLAAAVSVIKLANVPFYAGDAQYYLQIGYLWPKGQLALDASLVGDRHLVPLFYRLFLLAFGESIDAIGIALAAVFFIGVASAAVILFTLIDHKLFAFVGFCLFLALAYAAPIWLIPFSDNIFLAATLLLTALWVSGLKSRNKLLLVVALPLIAGVLASVRGEALIYAAVILLCIAVVIHSGRTAALAAFASCLVVGLWSGSVAWHLWVPAPKPVTYKAFGLFYYPNYLYASAANGPRSAELARRFRVQPTERLGDLFKVLAILNATDGPRETERIIRAMSIETLRARVWDVASSTVHEASKFLHQPEWRVTSDVNELWSTFYVSATPWEDQLNAAIARLRQIEARRYDWAGTFKDGYYQASSVLNRQLPIIGTLRSLIPPHAIRLRLPGMLLTFALCWLAVMLYLRSPEIVVLSPFIVVTALRAGLEAFSQGYHPRFAEPMLLTVALFLIASVGIRAARLMPLQSAAQRAEAGALKIGLRAPQ